MGERILREEGYEVVCVTDGDTALLRLEDVRPDVVIADALLPGKSGYELCEAVRRNAALRHTRVLLVVGLLEPFDEERARQVGSDGLIRKPFEASGMLGAVKPLVEAARIARGVLPAQTEPEAPPPEVDPALVRAAVTVAIEGALPGLIEDVTRRVLEALEQSGEVRIPAPALPDGGREPVADVPARQPEETPGAEVPTPAEEPRSEPAPALPAAGSSPEPAPVPEPATAAPEPVAAPPGEQQESSLRHWRGFHLLR